MNFHQGLIDLININGVDADYNMADNVLAQYLVDCLKSLDTARRKQDNIENGDDGEDKQTAAVDTCKYCKPQDGEHTVWCPSKEITGE